MANVNGSHNQVEIRVREEGRTRMVERVLLRCPNSKALLRSLKRSFPRLLLPTLASSTIESQHHLVKA